MSYDEYHDLFIKAQKSGKAHMFVYDLKNGLKEIKNNLARRQSNLMLLIYNTYQELKRLEKERGIKILYESEHLKYPELETFEKNGEVYYYLKARPDAIEDVCYGVVSYEPFLISGDAIGFTVNRDSITEEDVDLIFEQEKEKLGLKYEFHKANGYYETDSYGEGAELYYRGYCVQLLSFMHKDYKNDREVKRKYYELRKEK